MLLSVIIVNFNAKSFLEQCLHSLRKAVSLSPALAGHTEVFIVDNASDDGSLPFIEPLYPEFRFIRNTENKGFAKANNQALSACSGEFILFLNPDTILPEDTLDTVVRFFGDHPDAGAAGLRMVDGSGRFLKESKRGFPDPRAAFFRIFGLARLFPRSRFFSAYYAGHLDPDQDQAVDILSGAFMMVRKSAIDRTGGFDERFFMYGEDIDLSWRIRQAGFQNYYLASARIVHFKGESTPQDARYVKQFHQAMSRFIEKHGKGSGTGTQYLLKFGINGKRVVERVLLPFKRKSGRPGIQSLFIKGRPADLNEIGDKLQKAGYIIRTKVKEADAILFCESPGLTLKDIVEELDSSPEPVVCFIHGEGTRGAVGSPSGKEKGMIISL
ncbi:MAG TPA: glycosyltransferase family 2 protein [Puia sp.]|nr:glycosyltransferase family 2 protein [Puia sp.]